MDGPVSGKAPWTLTVRDLVERNSSARPDSPAVGAPGRTDLTYTGLLSHVDRTTKALRSFGIGRNDSVAVVLPNGPEMATAFLSISSAATCAPLNPGYRVREYDFYLSDLGAKALVVLNSTESPAREVALERGIPIIELVPGAEGPAGLFTLEGEHGPEASTDGPAEPGDVALVLHTSGTTSRPKIVPLAHANICTSGHNVATSLALARSDRCLNVMPLFHIHGLIGALLSSVSAGASIAATPGFEAPRFFSWVDECEPTWYSAVPTMHQAILARAEASADVIKRHPFRLIRSSSAALAPIVMERMEETFGCPVIESYGMTEAAHQMASNPLPPSARKPGSVGVAAGPEVEIMDEAGALLGAGAVGEIVIRGPNVTRGYENNPKANASAFTDGWFRTGDQGYFDDDSYLFITGRLKEIINRAGEKISPREVDEVLLDHPAIAQAVTFAVPDDRLGEEIGVAIILKEGESLTEMGVREYASETLADFKVPRYVVFLDDIPKGPTGKLQRIGLAEKLGLPGKEAEGSAPAEYVAPRNEMEALICRLWETHLEVERVGVMDDFFDLGGYSVLAARVFADLEKECGKRLPLAALFEAPTVEKLAALLDEGKTAEVFPSIIAIEKGGGGLPFFCIANADAFLYAALARALGGEAPFYGLHPQGIVSEANPRIDIERLASRYIELIKKVQPEGPYLVGGTCSSGIVAFEVAQQLKSRGDETLLLVMIDTPGPTRRFDRMGFLVRRIRRFGRHLLDHARTLWRLPWSEKGPYLCDNLKRVGGRVAGQGPAAPGLDRLVPIEEVYWGALKRARVRYRPDLYDGRVVMFLSPEELRRPGSGFSLRWKRYATGEVSIHRVADLHSEMLSAANVSKIAEPLKRHLDEARASVAAPGGQGASRSFAYTPPAPSRREYEGPRSPAERKLTEIWQEILGVERIGIHDDFFALGGDSVLASRVLARMADVFSIRVEHLRIFNAPTIEALARVVLAEKAGDAGEENVSRMIDEVEEAPPD